MPSSRYERAQEIARRLGFTSVYYRRQARTQELLGETMLDAPALRALEMLNAGEYQMSVQQAAKEAGIAPQRLRAIRGQAKRISRGNIRMITYTREYGIVFVDLDEANASYNASYLNYVRWTFNETVPGSKLTQPVSRSRVEEIGRKFSDFMHDTRDDKIPKRGFEVDHLHALAVYRARFKGGILDMEPEPFDFDVDLNWERKVDTLRQYEKQRAGATTSIYARR